MLKDNPYDIPRSFKKSEKFNILIHSDSISSEIKACSGKIEAIDKLNQLDEINVVFNPTEDVELRKIIENKYNSEIGSYKIKGNFMCFESKNFSGIVKILSKESYEEQFEKVNNTKLKQIDLTTMYNDMFDLVIVSAEDINQIKPDNRLTCINSVLELVRLYMINQKLFYVTKGYTIDETFYYIYRYKKIFYKYQYLWSAVCEMDSEIEKDDLMKYCDSLSTRLEFYCRACDQTKIECLKKPSNLTASYIKYNFGYLILIMTGIYDNLAWIINELYELNITDGLKVGIKIKKSLMNQNKKNYFLEELTSKDNKLAEFISDESIQNYIHLLYPIRDSLVHRDFLKSVQYCNKDNKIEKNLIKIPKIVYEDLKKIAITKNNYLDSFIVLDKIYYIEPYKFIEVMDDIFVRIVNNILREVDLSRITDKLSDKGKENFKQCIEKYESGLYEFFDLKIQPIYF